MNVKYLVQMKPEQHVNYLLTPENGALAKINPKGPSDQRLFV